MTLHLFTKAQRHLARRDSVLKQLIAEIGPCTLRHNSDRFALLVRSIISQQISGKAAASISGRLEQLLGPSGFTPKGLVKLSPRQLRSAGVSAAKARFLRDLAKKVDSGIVTLDELHDWPDEDVIAHLLPVLGIGRWTAEMFLIFSLGRLDVLPVSDLGLRVGVMRHYGLAEPPDKYALVELAERWRPYRTVATWYVWRSLGPVPQSDTSVEKKKT